MSLFWIDRSYYYSFELVDINALCSMGDIKQIVVLVSPDVSILLSEIVLEKHLPKTQNVVFIVLQDQRIFEMNGFKDFISGSKTGSILFCEL